MPPNKIDTVISILDKLVETVDNNDNRQDIVNDLISAIVHEVTAGKELSKSSTEKFISVLARFQKHAGMDYSTIIDSLKEKLQATPTSSPVKRNSLRG